MLSAGGYPVVLYGPIHLPQILPRSDALHAMLRTAHAVLAYVFFVTIMAHIAAALLHALIRRDGVFQAMASLPNSESKARNGWARPMRRSAHQHVGRRGEP